jgi:DNA-binding NarL/FixJ family response regulator
MDGVVIDEWAVVRTGLTAALARRGAYPVVPCRTGTAGLEALTGEAGTRRSTVLVVGSCTDVSPVDVVGRAARAGATVVAMPGAADRRVLLQLFDAGATVVARRDAPDDELDDALDHAWRGARYLAPSLVGAMSTARSGVGDERLPYGLTAREQAVLRHVVEGHSNREIAAELHIGAETVKSHLANIYAKLDVRRRQHAARLAVSHGLV